MSMLEQPLLEIRNLCISLPQPGGHTRTSRPLIKHVSLSLQRGEILGIVGESGSGKTLTCSSLLRLLPRGANISADTLRLDELDLLTCAASAIRGKRISMIFQDPAAALNPVFTIGAQIDAVLKRHRPQAARLRQNVMLDALDDVGLPDPSRAARSYPHELSGGMQQRVMIAMALAAGAELLIADEPTTALDVSVQARILELLDSLRARRGVSLLFISHDLAVVSQLCDRVAVMLNGSIVESGRVDRVVGSPEHEYTRALLASNPGLYAKGQPLPVLASHFVREDATGV